MLAKNLDNFELSVFKFDTMGLRLCIFWEDHKFLDSVSFEFLAFWYFIVLSFFNNLYVSLFFNEVSIFFWYCSRSRITVRFPLSAFVMIRSCVCSARNVLVLFMHNIKAMKTMATILSKNWSIDFPIFSRNTVHRLKFLILWFNFFKT